jgi:hypothetical protein
MKCVIRPEEKATTKVYHVACPMGGPIGKSKHVEIQTSNEAYPELLLGPARTGPGTIALDPTFVSFTLLKLVSH